METAGATEKGYFSARYQVSECMCAASSYARLINKYNNVLDLFFSSFLSIPAA